MISEQYIKSLDFRSLEDVFNYVVDSKINGNHAQVKELMKKLSDKQFIEFCRWYTQMQEEEFYFKDIALNSFVRSRVEEWKRTQHWKLSNN